MDGLKINKKINNNQGFTLIELLVVISIIGLLASITLVAFTNSREKGRIAAGVQFASEADDTAGDQSVGLWDFSECSGATAADHSNYGNNGTLLAGPYWTTDTPLWSVGSTSSNASSTGCSLLLVPSMSNSQYVRILNPSNGILDFGATTDFTLSAWVKTSTVSDYPFIIDKRGAFGGNGAGYTMYLDATTGRLCLHFGDGGPETAIAQCATSGASGADGKWHFYAISVQRASVATFYVDGSQRGTADVTSMLNKNTTTSNNVLLGTKDNTASNALAGEIDTVHIFAKALVASEVGNLYASEKQKFPALALGN